MRKTLLLLLLLVCSLPAAASPRSVVERLYASWLSHPSGDFLALHGHVLAPELRSKVSRAMALDDKTDGTFFDCDPITGSQEETQGFSLGDVHTAGRQATVEVFLRNGPSRPDSRLRGIKVELRREGRRWLVTDIVFNRRETLRKTCEELLAEARQFRARGGQK